MTQTDFATALLTPDLPTPAGLTDPEGRPTQKRFNVYRNNVAASLSDALEDGFPALRTLIGPTRFRALAGLFLRAHPPEDPRMMYFGRALPAFLDGFEPLQTYPYLPDVARLELALRESYHAADADPLSAEQLAAAADDLPRARLRLAPATRMLSSAYPVHAIWLTTQDDAAPKPQAGAEHILITRVDYDPVARVIPAEQAEALARIASGLPLGDALTDDTAQPVLTLILQSGAACALEV